MLYLIINCLLIFSVYAGILFHLIKQSRSGWEDEFEFQTIPVKQKQQALQMSPH
jgi:hypothetical protein